MHGWIRPFTADEDQAIHIAHAGTVSLTDLSLAMDRDPAVVSKHAIRMGLSFATRPHKASRRPLAKRPALTLTMILQGNLKTTAEQGSPPPANPTSPATAHAQDRRATILGLPGIPELPQDMLRAMQKAGLLKAALATDRLILLTKRDPR